MNRLIKKTRPNEPNTVFRYDVAGRLVNVNDGRTTSKAIGLVAVKVAEPVRVLMVVKMLEPVAATNPV
jgi:hypothetical protein